MKNILTSWGRGSEAVANFGEAILHRHRDGRCELLGGSAADHQAALEWAALFQHDAVFSVSGGTRLRRVVPGVSPGTRRTASLGSAE